MIDSLLQFAATCPTKGITILPSWYKYISKDEQASAQSGSCELKFAFPDDIGAILLAVVEILLRIGAIVAVFYVIYGGFLYMTSQGEPDKAKNAQTTITNAIIGLVVALLATAVVTFIGRRLI
jgi:hypothetical protein